MTLSRGPAPKVRLRCYVRDRLPLVGVAAVMATVVTIGFAPVVNLIIRVTAMWRASGEPAIYGQYGFSGTWIVGVLAGLITFGVGSLLRRRRRRRQVGE